MVFFMLYWLGLLQNYLYFRNEESSLNYRIIEKSY